MKFRQSDLGCSVYYLEDLEEPSIFKYKRVYNKWWGDWEEIEDHNSHVDIFAADGSGIDGLKKVIRKRHPTGIIIFADNLKDGNGTKLAKWLRECGQNVEETKPYVNHNHGRNNGMCKAWVWYWADKPVKVQENVKRRLSGGDGGGPVQDKRGKKVKEKIATSTDRTPASKRKAV